MKPVLLFLLGLIVATHCQSDSDPKSTRASDAGDTNVDTKPETTRKDGRDDADIDIRDDLATTDSDDSIWDVTDVYEYPDDIDTKTYYSLIASVEFSVERIWDSRSDLWDIIKATLRRIASASDEFSIDLDYYVNECDVRYDDGTTDDDDDDSKRTTEAPRDDSDTKPKTTRKTDDNGNGDTKPETTRKTDNGDPGDIDTKPETTRKNDGGDPGDVTPATTRKNDGGDPGDVTPETTRKNDGSNPSDATPSTTKRSNGRRLLVDEVKPETTRKSDDNGGSDTTPKTTRKSDDTATKDDDTRDDTRDNSNDRVYDGVTISAKVAFYDEDSTFVRSLYNYFEGLGDLFSDDWETNCLDESKDYDLTGYGTVTVHSAELTVYDDDGDIVVQVTYGGSSASGIIVNSVVLVVSCVFALLAF